MRIGQGQLTSVVGVCTLAAAIGTLGASVALFESMVLTPLRVRGADRLLHVAGLATQIPGYDAQRWWAQAAAVEHLGLYSAQEAVVVAGGTARTEAVTLVSDGFFAALDSVAVAGRALSSSDRASTGLRGAMVSESFAREAFGGAQSAVNQELAVADVPHVVVGVVPAAAEFPRLARVWILNDQALSTAVGSSSAKRPAWSGVGMAAVARLAPGASLEAARAQFGSLLNRLASEVTPRTRVSYGQAVRVTPLSEVLARDPRSALASFVALGVLGVLLSAASCGMLVLNEQFVRQREWAMRQALGATPSRVRALVASRALKLASLAAGLGVLAMYGSLRLVSHLGTSGGYYIPPIETLTGRYLVVSLLSAATAAAIVSVLPALWSARLPLAPVLNDRRPYALTWVPGWAVRSVLVGTQAAVAVAIVAGAAFSTRDLLASLTFDIGHRPNASAVVMKLRQAATLTPELQAQRWESTWRAAEAVPGTTAVAIISELPLDATGGGKYLESAPKPVLVARRFVLGPFERILGIDVRAGTPVLASGELLVSVAAMKELTGQSAPTVVRFDGGEAQWTIGGVLADIRFAGRANPNEAAVYSRLSDAGEEKLATPTAQLLVACQSSCSTETVAALAHAISPYAALDAPATTLGARYERTARAAHGRALVANIYAVLTLLIVIVGVHTLSGAVILRNAFEAGMRMALGAQRAEVATRLVAQVCTPAALGLLGGISVSAAAIRHWGLVAPTVSVTLELSSAAILLFATSVFAAALPAAALVRRPLVFLLRRD